MTRLAMSIDELSGDYDVIVVGSGYGGGVAASRLSRLGLRVCVLERGREFLPGEFPRNLLSANRETQVTMSSHRMGTPDALFDMRVGKGAHVLVGCGLGGTSLINASVCIEPDARVFEDAAWPEAIRQEGGLAEGYRRAAAMLEPQKLPDGERHDKLDALAVSARALGVSCGRVALHVALDDRVNAAGVHQPACTRCGDCMGGCNVGARTTVHASYLTDAVNHGAQLFTGARVRYVEKLDADRWRVVLHRIDGKSRHVPLRSVMANCVVLAAGTLGTNEILLRSRERGLKLSERLGERVSTNGDAISLGYNTGMRVGSIGVGHPARPGVPSPGPAVAGLIDLRARPKLEDGIVIVDAGVQSAYAAMMPLAMAAGGITGDHAGRGFTDFVNSAGRVLESAVGGAYSGAVANSQVFLAIGHDDSSGEIRLEKDRAEIYWPQASSHGTYGHIDAAVTKAVAATGGTYVANPLSKAWLGGNVLSVHPLGGAVTGDVSSRAVIDHKGRVFDPAGGAADSVHVGLYVCDGSAIPRSLGVHPLFTITAFAERAMQHLATDIGRTLDTGPKPGITQRAFHVSG